MSNSTAILQTEKCPTRTLSGAGSTYTSSGRPSNPKTVLLGHFLVWRNGLGNSNCFRRTQRYSKSAAVSAFCSCPALLRQTERRLQTAPRRNIAESCGVAPANVIMRRDFQDVRRYYFVAPRTCRVGIPVTQTDGGRTPSVRTRARNPASAKKHAVPRKHAHRDRAIGPCRPPLPRLAHLREN